MVACSQEYNTIYLSAYYGTRPAGLCDKFNSSKSMDLASPEAHVKQGVEVLERSTLFYHKQKKQDEGPEDRQIMLIQAN